jgi:hypothetical protein
VFNKGEAGKVDGRPGMELGIEIRRHIISPQEMAETAKNSPRTKNHCSIEVQLSKAVKSEEVNRPGYC